MQKIADSGLLIAGLDARDPYHAWARDLFESEEPPWLVCEPVLHEVSLNIRSPQPLLEMLKVGDLEVAFDLRENVVEVLALIKKYRDQEMDLADACVVRMSELFEDCRVYTVDRSDFSVYRRYSRRPIPCTFPD